MGVFDNLSVSLDAYADGLLVDRSDLKDAILALRNHLEGIETDAKAPIKRKYTRHDLERDRLRTMHMVFVYLPGGPEVFTGSINRIADRLTDAPTSHAVICNQTMHSYEFACFSVFGKYQQHNYKKYDFYVDIVEGSKHNPPEFLGNRVDWSNYLTARKRYFLVKFSNAKVEFLRSWRRLPKKHLKDLAHLDNPELVIRNEENRFTRLEL